MQVSIRRASIVRVALASWIGTSIEWYDFYLYTTAAALVLGPLFFSPKLSPLAAQLASYATLWVGFAARPVGGVVFGHFGDRIGRKTMLILTLMIMGVATFLVGCLPTFKDVGILAPTLLVILRFAQGFAVGGEWGGAVLMATEHAPEERRGFYGSWPQMGVPMGLLLSSLIFSLTTSSFSKQDFLGFAWRIPFLLSIIIVGVGLFIRLSITETPDFERVRESRAIVRIPLLEVLRTSWKTVILAAGAFFVVNGAFYIFITFIVSYGTTTLHVPSSTMLNGTLIGAIAMAITIIVAGNLSDRVGRLPVYLAGAVFMALIAFPVFWLVDTKLPLLIDLGLALGIGGIGIMYGPQAAFFSELFGANIRYSGASFGYQITAIFAGGLAPFVAVYLLTLSHNASWPVALYVIGMAVITFVCTYLAGETRPRADAKLVGGTAGE